MSGRLKDVRTTEMLFHLVQSHTSLVDMFFEECDIYWKPASDSANLYEQLARNKYREISRYQIK